MFFHGNRLQWGRDLLIAEIQRIHYTPYIDPKLQWGRDLLIAEMNPPNTSTHAAACFNGAAIC